jgi:hypothetical protein
MSASSPTMIGATIARLSHSEGTTA